MEARRRNNGSAIILVTVLVLASWLTVGYSSPVAKAAPAATDGVWTNITPSLSPLARSHPGLVYDGQADLFIMFGGSSNLRASNETWTFDLSSDEWTNMTPSSHPWALEGAPFAYDSEADRAILFGESSHFGYQLNSTWAYDYFSDSWTNLDASGAPSTRYYCPMAYDSQSDMMILFGGVRFEGPYALVFNETWAYDFYANSWTNMMPSVHPHARFGQTMVYDSQSDRMILFGGFYEDAMMVGPTIWYDDTWSYDFESNRWTNLSTMTNPGARMFASSAYDSQNDRVLLFGGQDPGSNLDDTWTYDYGTNQWMHQNPLNAPPPTAWACMAYSPTDGEAVLFSLFQESSVFVSETWAYAAGPPVPEFSLLLPSMLVTIVIPVVLRNRIRRLRA